jgi:hypothetical protein
MNKLSNRLVLALLLVPLVMAFGVQVAPVQGEEPTFPESHQDFLGAASYGAYFGLNASHVPLGPGTPPGGTGQPPRVGANNQINDPQVPAPNGLLGRSETTIASDPSGRFLLSGCPVGTMQRDFVALRLTHPCAASLRLCRGPAGLGSRATAAIPGPMPVCPLQS